MSIDSGRFRSDAVRAAYAYWRSKCVRDRLPGRGDIRPEELRHVLPWLFLVDVIADPVEFRYRLIGSEVTRLAGVERTGCAVTESEFGAYWREVFDNYLAVVTSRVPSYVDGDARWSGREFQHHERLIMPLSSDGVAVDMLLGVLHPTELRR